MNKNDPFIRTFTDREFHFLNFGPEDIYIEDIAHALSNICRYGGHSRKFYSVGEHSIKCCKRGVDWSSRIWGLLHDAAEAYIGDLPKPFKNLLSFNHQEIFQYEDRILKAIAEKFGLPWPIPKKVYRTDRKLFDEEMKILWNDEVVTMSSEDVEWEFLSRFRTLELAR